MMNILARPFRSEFSIRSSGGLELAGRSFCRNGPAQRGNGPHVPAIRRGDRAANSPRSPILPWTSGRTKTASMSRRSCLVSRSAIWKSMSPEATSSASRASGSRRSGRWTWHRQERGYGKFSRLLTLPCDVKTDEVEAEFKDGVLTIKLPKSEAAKPRRLAIKAE